jgi:hypothetical protein
MRHQMHFRPRHRLVPERLLDRDLAARTVATTAQVCNRPAFQVAHLHNLNRVVGEGVEQVRPPATNSIAAVIAALDGHQPRDDLHVNVISAREASRSRRLKASKPRRTNSTFSVDIARAVSRLAKLRRASPTAQLL